MLPFLQGMRDYGYEIGSNLTCEYRYADGNAARLPSLAEELIQRQPNVVVTTPMSAAFAMKRATSHLPIVGSLLTDPIGFGLVQREARPGTNVTGILSRVEGLPGKMMQLALELLPEQSLERGAAPGACGSKPRRSAWH